MTLIIFDFNRTIYNPDNKKLISGTKEVIIKLKQTGFKLAIVGKGSAERKKLIQKLGLKELFDDINIKKEKSESQFKEMLKKFGETPETCYSVGDRVKKDIKYSNNVGLKTIWFKQGKFSTEEPKEENEKPDYTVSSFKEILNIVK